MLAVLTAAFFVWSITRRVNPRPTDWAMGSLALLGILFYPKGLERADMAHLAGSLVFAVPLLVYVAVRILDPGIGGSPRSRPDVPPATSSRWWSWAR